MSSHAHTLSKQVTDILEDSLEEFTDARKVERKEILNRLTRETLPDGSNAPKHKKVRAIVLMSIKKDSIHHIF